MSFRRGLSFSGYNRKCIFLLLFAATRMGPREYHTKWIKSDRERQILYTITYMCNLKNNANESIYKKETDSLT